jgi:hypothetical protein
VWVSYMQYVPVNHLAFCSPGNVRMVVSCSGHVYSEYDVSVDTIKILAYTLKSVLSVCPNNKCLTDISAPVCQFLCVQTINVSPTYLHQCASFWVAKLMALFK